MVQNIDNSHAWELQGGVDRLGGETLGAKRLKKLSP
jgi:hypothetical protein